MKDLDENSFDEYELANIAKHLNAYGVEVNIGKQSQYYTHVTNENPIQMIRMYPEKVNKVRIKGYVYLAILFICVSAFFVSLIFYLDVVFMNDSFIVFPDFLIPLILIISIVISIQFASKYLQLSSILTLRLFQDAIVYGTTTKFSLPLYKIKGYQYSQKQGNDTLITTLTIKSNTLRKLPSISSKYFSQSDIEKIVHILQQNGIQEL